MNSPLKVEKLPLKVSRALYPKTDQAHQNANPEGFICFVLWVPKIRKASYNNQKCSTLSACDQKMCLWDSKQQTWSKTPLQIRMASIACGQQINYKSEHPWILSCTIFENPHLVPTKPNAHIPWKPSHYPSFVAWTGWFAYRFPIRFTLSK